MLFRHTLLLNGSPASGRLAFVAVVVSLSLIGGHLLPSTQPTRVESKYEVSDAMPVPQMLVSFCGGCHSSGRAGVNLDVAVDQSSLLDDRRIWERVLRKVRSQQMPPTDVKTLQLTREARQRVIDWIEQGLAANSEEEAGQPLVWARLLQRREYQNAVRDLLNVSIELANDQPADARWRRSPGNPVLTGAVLKRLQDSADAVLAKVDLSRLIENGAGHYSLGAEATGCKSHAELWDAEEAAERVQPILISFAARAYRRPISSTEAFELDAAFVSAANAGNDFDGSVKAALKVMLTSPNFLYRIEHVGDSDDGDNAVQSHELASRLSFFLWGSVPDDELWELAQRGTLRQNLDGQVQRMLKDSKARSFGREFAAFWLKLGALGENNGIDQHLLQAMREETERFVSHIVDEDRSVREFVDADYTFLNERLARHYGIAGVQGDAFRRVSTVGTRRGGLLTQGSILSLTSRFDQTSIALRGRWVLDNLLDTPPPDPPPGLLTVFRSGRENSAATSRRKLVDQHRISTFCAECHAPMDAFGSALENFDHAGVWRTVDGRHPIDARGVLPTGESFDGPLELKAHLRSKQALLVRGLGGKLLSYALGRRLRESDADAVEAIAQAVFDNQARFASIVLEVIKSETFQRGGR